MKPIARTSRPAGEPLGKRYGRIRAATEALCAPLRPDDYVVQSMPDVSPAKWHLAHVTWFFETFVLTPCVEGYRPFHPRFEYLFNSYYNAVGEQYPRLRRGLLTRPTTEEIYAYRAHVDAAMERLLESGEGLESAGGSGPAGADGPGTAGLVELGLNHEQQHQELLLMDIKHVLSCNPLRPAYLDPDGASRGSEPPAVSWPGFDGGEREIGHEGPGFGFDNERPRHRVLIEPFELASRPVTSGEYLEFIEAGGYRDPRWWLADGWAAVQAEGWTAPLYWRREGEAWREFTLRGERDLDLHAPVSHLSYYEAWAYAAWADARLPTEAEWEVAAGDRALEGHFVERGLLHPSAPEGPASTDGLLQLFGDVWEWTRSAYAPYPGFRPAQGALGEYNGKFMCNQMVMRGGCCVTPRDHVRATYRNFFYPTMRWHFAGLRLARDPR